MQQGQSGPYVFVVQPDGTCAVRPVTVGETLDGRALIDHGLHAGDTVVTAGQYRLERWRQGRQRRAGDPQRAEQQRSQRGDAVMSLSSPFIRRPVATALLMVAIVLLGGVAYELLPVAALPNVSFPTIAVTAQLPGADPQTMASSVATPLEKQFGQIPYLTQMTSTSSTGYTQITLQFALNDDINAAAQLVQTAINAAAGQLPKNMPTPPTYHETNPADAPILVLGLTSDVLPITTVDDYAESILAQKLSQVPGVGLVGIGGEQHPAVRIQFNPAQLAANGLDLEDVRTALTNVSVIQPKGSLYGQTRTYTLQTTDQILKPQDWDNQIIAYRNGGPIRVRDVGQADHRAAGRNAEGLGQSASRHHSRRPAAAGRQRHQHGAGDQGCAAATGTVHPADHQGLGDLGSHDDHPRLGRGRAVHAAADDRPGRRRDLPVPAQSLGNAHSRRSRSPSPSSARSA